MSPKIPSLKAGLTALGLFGLTASSLADPGDTAPPPRASTASPSPAPSMTPTVLLLSDGRVLQGKLVETESGFMLHQRGGSLPLRKSQVEKTFGSIEEVYKYKVGRVPPRDPDELLKLAKWCLTWHMDQEAKAHLQEALGLSPGSGEIKAMLAHLAATEERRALRDEGVVRSGAEIVTPGAPEELPPLSRRRPRGRTVPALPRILDLPQGLAVKRAQEFDTYVQPVLQKYCAQCHNEQYPGDFQLIPIKTRHDRTLEVFRANLDASLRLVDPDDPAKSDLLSSTLRPHGSGPRKRPIFLGSNDPAYQVLSTWVNRLRSPNAMARREPAGDAVTSGSDEGFAVDRSGAFPRATVPAAPPRRGLPAVLPETPEQMAPSRYIPGRGMVFEQTPPTNDEFPVSPLLGGPRPKPTPLAGQPPAAGPPAAGASSPDPLPALPAMAPSPALDKDKDKTTGDVPAKKARKPVKIDPALLERALKVRNTAK